MARKITKKGPARKKETLDSKKERMKKILRKLKKNYPDSRCSLYFDSPFQLLVATILSAQCTDERVNKVTPGLFQKFPTPYEFANASLEEIEEEIRSTGFYHSKAKSLKETSVRIVEKHGGEVPQELDALVELRGVGRKTANVLLGTAFGVPGLVVDTHVGRISRRMGFTRQKDPVKVEHEMMEVVPKKDWVIYSHLLIDHGRAVCLARQARCEGCFLVDLCSQVGV